MRDLPGGLIVVVVGGDRGVLWAVLPFAVLLAAYAPQAISFTAGQGAFTLVVLVLFNLINPAGWKVGLVRVEDVAIGAGVSRSLASCSGRAARPRSCAARSARPTTAPLTTLTRRLPLCSAMASMPVFTQY